MSCSKIFLGDLPELTYEVTKYFHNDFSTLYSCVLVNRLWCRLAIPLLWENPFSIRTRNYKHLEIYLQYLNEDIKTQLKEYEIINNSLPSNTFFNYYIFLKYLNIYKFAYSFEKWLKDINKTSPFEIRFKILNDICTALFKIFIENEIKLHTLEIEIFTLCKDTIYDNIIKLILKNPNFINNIRNLKYYGYDCCNRINDNILQLIKSHQNPKKFLLTGCINLRSNDSLLLSKDFNFSNTLNTIIFYRANLKHLINNIFEQLNVLESVHIIYCYSLNENFSQQINNLIKPFKLKSLFIKELPEIESMELLLQKSGNYLENFGCKLGLFGLLLNQRYSELIIKYCKNLKFFDFHGYESQITYQSFENIIRQNLSYLSINIVKDGYDNIEGSSIILQNLGQALPSKLEYLSLVLTINRSEFRIFLQNSKDTFINKLLIMQIGRDDILRYTKEFIMNEKRVKYLAIKSRYNGDLYDLEDEVKEFKLHNIKVRSFNDLSLSDNLNSNLIDYLQG
ncbi:uncharacterized protein OCT59_025320 [Rhizophagus irregularis]|uniref:F-box domain-containing protein n=3 Tax=Rhizophagus irregularis TaxID=588596 RepID=A0A2H5R0N0_RHIID|nr:hypothetical protein GLOIN_2v1882546 [Rhizophagus irregularis DAOM 181602=DAOM 197198]POG62905.1 hypothetical protein GLOIN_2v1882546 [Rhizophagus irregularis DAOM 181602=DAOM 197198]UZO04959.1 hypothetical protein OCT59_025320 [Rhizophagus irregularis]|eukprot:XP_025169771.1 hypothetical protein GLOIN_2v1882546 [Rhizophagus irregularis DAOM 181602=DAOM 197198]